MRANGKPRTLLGRIFGGNGNAGNSDSDKSLLFRRSEEVYSLEHVCRAILEAFGANVTARFIIDSKRADWMAFFSSEFNAELSPEAKECLARAVIASNDRWAAHYFFRAICNRAITGIPGEVAEKLLGASFLENERRELSLLRQVERLSS